MGTCLDCERIFTIARANMVNIQHPDNKFNKDIIRMAFNCTKEQKASDIGELYDDLIGPGITVTTYFHANGWYHITNVDTKSEVTEQKFWNELRLAVQRYPHRFNPA